MVEFPFEFTRALPELNRIGIVGGEESPKVTENSSGVDLERVQTWIKDFLGHMNGVRDDYNLGDIVQRTSLVDATSYSE